MPGGKLLYLEVIRKNASLEEQKSKSFKDFRECVPEMILNTAELPEQILWHLPSTLCQGFSRFEEAS